MTGPNFDPAQGPAYDVLATNDERLTLASEPVPTEQIASPEIQEIIDTMLAISRGERGTNLEKVYMVGLAAPQLGIMKRIIVVDTQFRPGERPATQDGISPLQAFINPEIIEASETTEDYYEGCYSFGANSDVFGVVSRPSWVKVRAYDSQGQRVTIEAEGFTARIFEHEIDHLDGLRYFQRMQPNQPLHFVSTEDIIPYGKEGGWQDWHKHVNVEDILAPDINRLTP